MKNLVYLQKSQIDSPDNGLDILNKIHPVLQKQVKYQFYWKVLKNSSIFAEYSELFLKDLIHVMHEKIY